MLALITHPPLLESNEFPEDVKQRARGILQGCKGQGSDKFRIFFPDLFRNNKVFSLIFLLLFFICFVNIYTRFQDQALVHTVTVLGLR